MIRKLIAAALLASTASVGAAQTTTTTTAPASAPAQAAPAAAAAPDPARLAAARRFVDAAMPQSLFEQAIIAGVRGAAAETSGNADAARRDPHHAERSRIELRVMEEESMRILRDLDPNLRALMADYYARSLGAAELDESAAFYSSPAGRRFAAGALTIGMNPEYQRSMEALAPHLGVALHGAEQRYAAATANLPPIPGVPTPRAQSGPQRTPPAPPPVTLAGRPGPAADPVRLASARRALDALWPSDLFRHTPNMQPVLETLIAIRVGDFGVPVPPSAGINPNSTLAEIGAGFDPHLRQRLPVLSRFFGSEMARITTAMEPGWKLLTADAYAREFTAAELDEVTRFFSTPAGRRLALESYKTIEDPQLARGIVMLIPRVAMQIPAISQRVQQATAHLPAPPPAPAPLPPPAPRSPRN
ncbi:MAG TPA: DUF2059 domain-containing protein [Allosphingosinicella sp.]|jgi:hypothetical protein